MLIPHAMNKIYHGFSSLLPIAKSYSSKFLLVSIAAIYLPLTALVVYIFINPAALSISSFIGIFFLVTILAIGGTYFIFNKLLEPLRVCKNSMSSYLDSRIIPNLPTHYNDEAGVLMQQAQDTIASLDMLLEEKKDLIGLLSHDLRTPLSGILLLSAGMERTVEMTNEQRRQMAGMISSSAKDQMGLFLRILEILKNDDLRTSHLDFKKIKVERLLSKSKEEMASLAAEKNLTIDVVINGDLSILADEHLLTQVIKNLINNAIKFSHPNSTIHIAVNQKEELVCITVKDDGVGFNPEDAQALFARYTEKRRLGTNNEMSTGMGLYLSSKIIKAHNGLLKAESAGLNMGATFTLELN